MNLSDPWISHLALLVLGVVAVVALFGVLLWLLLPSPGQGSPPLAAEPRGRAPDEPPGTARTTGPAPSSPPPPGSPAPDTDALLAAIREGRKIEAIKLYRERTGLGLREAKDAVEALERGQPLAAAPPLPAPVSSPGGTLDAVHAALRSGNKILAIKHYREATGVGLKEAKDAVEALDGTP